MEKLIVLKDLDKFVLSPGAKFYDGMCQQGDCTSPEDLAEFLELKFGAEKYVVLDFLYDRIPLDDNLIALILKAKGLDDVDVFRECYKEKYEDYVEKKNKGYRIIGIDELLGRNFLFSDTDIEQIYEKVRAFVAKNRTDREKLIEIRSLLLEAWSKLQKLNCLKKDWALKNVDEEILVAEQIELATAILRQRALALNEDHSKTIRQFGNTIGYVSRSGCNIHGLFSLLKQIEEEVLGGFSADLDQCELYHDLFVQKAKAGTLPWFLL